MSRERVRPILVTGATGRVGRVVVDQLLAAGVPVRALTRRPDAAGLPATVEVVAGDLTVPESLDAALQGVSAVFLLWTAPPTTVPAAVDRLAWQVRRGEKDDSRSVICKTPDDGLSGRRRSGPDKEHRTNALERRVERFRHR